MRLSIQRPGRTAALGAFLPVRHELVQISFVLLDCAFIQGEFVHLNKEELLFQRHLVAFIDALHGFEPHIRGISGWKLRF